MLDLWAQAHNLGTYWEEFLAQPASAERLAKVGERMARLQRAAKIAERVVGGVVPPAAK